MRQDALLCLLDLVPGLRPVPEHRLQRIGVDLEEERRHERLIHPRRLHRGCWATRNLDHLREDGVESVFVEADAVQRIPELLALAHGDKMGSNEIACPLLDLVHHLANGIRPAGRIRPLVADGLVHAATEPGNAPEDHDDASRSQSAGEVSRQLVPILLVC